jgi:hypothetical protein
MLLHDHPDFVNYNKLTNAAMAKQRTTKGTAALAWPLK